MTVKAIKGFRRDWTCRGYQFQPGGEYRHDGDVKACSSGFHAIEGYPLDVFEYYPPATSIYAYVEMDGNIDSHDGDSKIAAEVIRIGQEVGLSQLISDAVAWTMDRAEPSGVASSTGYQSVASNTGDQSVASNTGDRGVATSTGDQSVASNTGYQSVASNTGDRGVATSTGYQSVASNTGNRGVATSTGYQGVALADNGSFAVTNGYGGRVRADGPNCPIACAERDGSYPYRLISVACGISGRDGIKVGVWYQCRSGKLVEVEE